MKNFKPEGRIADKTIGTPIGNWILEPNILTQEERDQAIQNVIMLNEDPDYVFERKMPTAASALFVAFSWEYTPEDQGYNYWNNIMHRINKVQFRDN